MVGEGTKGQSRLTLFCMVDKGLEASRLTWFTLRLAEHFANHLPLDHKTRIFEIIFIFVSFIDEI